MISIDVCVGQEVRRHVSLDDVRNLLPANVDPHGPIPDAGETSVFWVDVTSPTEEDWKRLEESFRFHPLAIEDARQRGQRAKLDTYDGYQFLSVHAWKDDARGGDVTEEIDIFLGPRYLVTLHAGGSKALEETRERMEKNPERLRRHPAHLLYLLLDAVVDEFFPAMDALDEAIDERETQVYAARGNLDVKPALELKRRLLLLRQAVAPMRDVLNALMRIDDEKLMPRDLQPFYQDVYDHTLRLTEQIDVHRDLLSSVLDAMMAQTSNRLNQVMKTMTAVSTILMSATIITGVYGMNFKNMPELDWRYGYPLALGFMVAVALALTAYFRRIGWF